MVTTGESSPLNSQAGCATGGQAHTSSDKDVAPLLTSVFKESLVETQTQTRLPNDTSQRAVSFSEPSLPKAASNDMVDDLTPIFGGSSASGGEPQEIEGEPQGRRQARFEPARKTQECAAEALGERNKDNLQAEKETGEKHVVVTDVAMEQMIKDVEKMERQMNADKAEVQRLRKRIEGLKGERVFESELFQYCRELLNMRIARGRTPLSIAEEALLKEMKKLAVNGIKQYTNVKGSAPAFICPCEDCPHTV